MCRGRKRTKGSWGWGMDLVKLKQVSEILSSGLCCVGVHTEGAGLRSHAG